MTDNTPQPAPRLGDEEARAATVAEKTARDKTALIEQLKKTPVIQIACEKAGVSRQTYYRWRKDDDAFAAAADEALSDGKTLVNDLAESQLLTALKNGDPWSIQYWLRHHHGDYSNRLEITSKDEREAPLTLEQQELLRRSLELSSLLPSQPDHDPPGTRSESPAAAGE